MEHLSVLEQDGVTFAIQAVRYDQGGQYETAKFYYMEAAQALLHASDAGSRLNDLFDKVKQYVERVEQLNRFEQPNAALPSKSSHQLDLEKARFLIEQAFQEDESGNTADAVDLYTETVDLCIQLRQNCDDEKLISNITKLAKDALNRAEELKRKTHENNSNISPPESVSNSVSSKKSNYKPLGTSLFDNDVNASAKANVKPTSPSNSGGGFSKSELMVLRNTSYINNREYVPFMSVDIKERFAFPVPYSDKFGLLALSPQQKLKFSKYVRPEEFMNEPTMIYAISCFSIKQTIVSDCSFVASLAISAQYERKFKKKLVTSLIYPQNRNGDPQYNPCGKYMVKLNLNGVPRKVIVDDFFPMDRHGSLLCSYSNNRNELWISILEKAYMKVMGGYDFPGSNSNIDLNALTGWIPERLSVASKDFKSDYEFDRILNRFHKGHCLVTVATGEMSEHEADRAGLVPTHAYALIDIRNVQNKKLVQLKNPWSHLRWKGNFSEKDTANWTKSMQKALNYDPNSAATYDNGVFWIDYESLLKFFGVIYVNWNPELFQFTNSYHHTWTAKEGPKKDAYNIGDNPQYQLSFTSNDSVVWILLSRHITDKEDFANNREFITVLVYKTDGKRVFYPYDPPPYKDGVRINSPHYLCKLQEKDPATYTLVIAQYEKSNTIHYTLRIYSTCKFSFKKMDEPYDSSYEKKITGEWKGRSAGGCANYRETHQNNPIYQLGINNNSVNNCVMIEVRGPKDYSVGFEVTTISQNVTNNENSFTKKSSGTFRPGFVVMELNGLSGGVYNIMPCTFQPSQEGPFFLNVSSSCPITLSKLK